MPAESACLRHRDVGLAHRLRCQPWVRLNVSYTRGTGLCGVTYEASIARYTRGRGAAGKARRLVGVPSMTCKIRWHQHAKVQSSTFQLFNFSKVCCFEILRSLKRTCGLADSLSRSADSKVESSHLLFLMSFGSGLDVIWDFSKDFKLF